MEQVELAESTSLMWELLSGHRLNVPSWPILQVSSETLEFFVIHKFSGQPIVVLPLNTSASLTSLAPGWVFLGFKFWVG